MQDVTNNAAGIAGVCCASSAGAKPDVAPMSERFERRREATRLKRCSPTLS
jgi:hypothetical protein